MIVAKRENIKVTIEDGIMTLKRVSSVALDIRRGGRLFTNVR